MVTNYYNSSNNYSSPVRQKEPKPYETRRDEDIILKEEKCQNQDAKNNDKVLLLGLLAILYLTDCDDLWLLLAILFLALS